MIWPFRRNTAKKKQKATRLGIFLWAFLLCAIAGAIAMPEPLEDIYRGGRNMLRARPADQSIAVVAVDDATVAAFGTLAYSRSYDAKVVELLFAKGAKRVYYDRAFADRADAAGDAAFADVLAKYRGKVFLGALVYSNRASGNLEFTLPIPQLRSMDQIRSLHGASTPFSLSAELVYGDEIAQQNIPSITADLSNTRGPAGVRYRPDWSIQVKTVPTISFLDLVNGRVSSAQIAGKDILVGVTTQQSADFLQVAGQNWFPGVYVHAVGAQTLREGHPISIGWIPAMLVAVAFSGWLLRERSRKRAVIILVTAGMVGLATPFVLDYFFITADFIAAYMMFGIVAYRSMALRVLAEARLQNAETMMPNLSALREEPLASTRPIVAMRIKNYAAIGASFAESVEDELVTEIARRLSLPGEKSNFYQAEDVLYWLGPSLPIEELTGHLEGLARLIESQFIIRKRTIDIHVAFGIDVDVSRQVANRIGRALLAADTAAAQHQLMQFNTSENDAESAWELSLMSELDAAIDHGDIWVAYQPQFDLRDDRINGAEALARWQHPTRGAISPEAFILSAEAHNRIKRLTFYILEQATFAAKSIVEENPTFRLSVNVSASLLELPRLPDQITAVLLKTGFPVTNLTLEVTESAPFREHQIVAANMAAIAALGIDLSIDDYGTGNATLDYIRSVPCQEIKIDRRFVAGLTTNPGDLMLVESTIELAHGLDRRVVAEGIEDPDTLELLRAIGCDTVQGFYLAKPMRIEALKSLVAKNRRVQAA